MPSATKRTKRFVSSGGLKKQIKQRHEHKAAKARISGRENRSAKGKKWNSSSSKAEAEGEDGLSEEEEAGKKMSVEDFMNSGFDAAEGAAADSDEDGAEINDKSGQDESEGDEDLGDDLGDSDSAGEGSEDEYQDEAAHAATLQSLAEKDPEFFKYLQENDSELLNFGQDDEPAKSSEKGKKSSSPLGEEDEEMESDASESDSDDDMDEPEKPSGPIVLTKEMVKGWQRGMIEHHSLRSLRRLLLAFRSASTSQSKEASSAAYKIEDSAVFNKLVLTALKYTPVVLAHHLPFTVLPNGRSKLLPALSPSANLPKLALSYLHSLMLLVRQLDDQQLIKTCILESAKLTPWIFGWRKGVKDYVKFLLEFWSEVSSSDEVRIASLLSIRKIINEGDEAMIELILKGIYLNFLRSCMNTTVHTLPRITFMKNSAAEIYSLVPEFAYAHAFGFIRQLAIHLRGAIKVQTKDAYKAVYNWQYVHSLDFWSIILSVSCDRKTGATSALQPLIYPLVQISIGAIKLVPTPRYFPLRFHIIRLLLRLNQRTNNFIPLSPFILEVLDSSELRHKAKSSTLKPLPWEVYIRAPTSYPRTRVYQDGLAEEATFLLLEYFASNATSIAFPELCVPTMVLLKRVLKKSPSAKLSAQMKTIIEKLEAHKLFIEKERRSIDFSPSSRADVDSFLAKRDCSKSPIVSWLRLQAKARAQLSAQTQEIL